MSSHLCEPLLKQIITQLMLLKWMSLKVNCTSDIYTKQPSFSRGQTENGKKFKLHTNTILKKNHGTNEQVESVNFYQQIT